MTFDIIFPSFAILAGLAAAYALTKIRGVHLLVALLYAIGGAFAAFAGFLICYPLLGDTAMAFLPAPISFVLWTGFFARIVGRYIFWIRSQKIPASQ